VEELEENTIYTLTAPIEEIDGKIGIDHLRELNFATKQCTGNSNYKKNELKLMQFRLKTAKNYF